MIYLLEQALESAKIDLRHREKFLQELWDRAVGHMMFVLEAEEALACLNNDDSVREDNVFKDRKVAVKQINASGSACVATLQALNLWHGTNDLVGRLRACRHRAAVVMERGRLREFDPFPLASDNPFPGGGDRDIFLVGTF